MHEQRTRRTRRPAPLLERFRRYYTPADPTACWEWTGSRDNHGYGKINRGVGLGNAKAHRLAWEIHLGPIPDGLWVLHRCDNPPCVNPAHLFLGTPRDNTRDMLSKGRNRTASGAENGKTVYADSVIREIREAAAAGESYGALAERFGLTPKYVCALVLGQRRAAAGGPIRAA